MIVRNYRKFSFAFLIFLSVYFFAPEIFAKRLPVKIYTSADGLGSSFVDYLMRDSRGFMWFCTRDGLSRFDGSRFVNYQIGNENSPPGIESIFETSEGVYWISTTGGTYRFDPRDIPPPGTDVPRLNAEFIPAIGRGQFYEDKRGNLWVLSGALGRIIEQDGKFLMESVPLNLPSKSTNSLLVNGMRETDDGSLWMDTTWGLVRLLPDNRKVFYPLESTIGGGASSILADNSGRIWHIRPERLLIINPEPIESLGNESVIIKSLEPTGSVELIPDTLAAMPKKSGDIFRLTHKNSEGFLENTYVKMIYQTSDGDIWITSENKLLQFSAEMFRLHTSEEGLPNVMGRMAEDTAGNLWIGGHAGLARLDRQGLVSFGTDDGLNSTRLFAIVEDTANGTVYFVGRDFYLNRFDGIKFQTVRPAIPANSNYLWTSRFGMRAKNGEWWILTNEKLYRFANVSDFAELDGKQPTKTYDTANGLGARQMFQIFEDASNTIWVSTRGAGDNKGIARLKTGEERFQILTEADGLPKAKSFSSAVEDTFGNSWFSFYEGGLARFDGEKFQFFGENDGLPTGLLSDLHLDKKGRLWIGSTLGGLIWVNDTNAKKPQFVYLTTTDGLTSNNIRTITEDKFGRIYIGTARGVDRISPETRKVKHYSVSDGLAADFVTDSHCDKDGNLWFATNNGLSRLTPLPDEKTVAPRILLGGLRIAGLEQAISEIGTLQIEKGELSHTQNNLQIEFFGLDFRAGETLRYQYKLEGADADWSLPTELRTVTYGNLSPANYRFFVRAVNSDGVVSANEAMISFKILPPIWARWWFILLAALLVTLVIIMLYRYRTARLREINQALAEANRAEENLRKSREERLAELEKVRSRIATDLHDDIGASLTQIAILSEVAQAQSQSNGASKSLTKITDVSNELVGTMSDIVWSINPSKDHLSDLTQRMRRFASDVLSAKGIVFQFHLTGANKETIVNTNVRREVFLIFKESVNNIAKHSGAKQAIIELKILENDLTLEISDDGKGFAAEKSFENSLSSIEMGGNGIASMKKRAAEMNGKFEIIAEIGKGTIVRIKLPMGENEKRRNRDF